MSDLFVVFFFFFLPCFLYFFPAAVVETRWIIVDRPSISLPSLPLPLH